jgi:hypothetical protein
LLLFLPVIPWLCLPLSLSHDPSYQLPSLSSWSHMSLTTDDRNEVNLESLLSTTRTTSET